MATLRSTVLTCAIGSVTAVACTSSMGPDAPTLAQHTRSQGSVTRVALSGGPLGVAISATGVTYVTRDQAASIARLNATETAFSDTIPVGNVPSFIAFNPAGTTAYVANQFSDNVGIIDVATNTQTTVIPVTGDPLPVAVAPDGSTLFTTTNVNQLFKIDLATNTVVGSLPLPATSHHLLVHPNDTLLYVATRDGGSVLEVNWRTMTVARTFTLGGRTQGMALAPDQSELFVANEFSNVLQIINLSSGAITQVPLAGGGEGLALSADNQRLYVGLVFNGVVQVIDRSTRAIINTLNTGGVPREIAADPTQDRAIVANEAGWIDIIAGAGPPPPDTGTVTRVFLSGGPLGIAATAAGVTYVTRDQASSVARLNRRDTAFSTIIPVGNVPSFIAFNPAGTTAYVANQFSDNVGIIDVATNTQTTVIPVTGDPLPVAVAPDGSTLFTTTNVNQLFKIDLATNTVVGSLPLPATSHHLLVHPNDTLLYVATRDGGSVLEVNWRTMTVARTFTLGGRTQGMALAPDQSELFVANEFSNVLQIINLSSGAITQVPLAGGGEGLALSADNQRLYVGLVFIGQVQVIDRQSRAIIQTFHTGGRPREIAAQPAMRTVLVANEAGWVDVISP
jgi:YVTN family beta-propeller protein